VKSRAPLAAPYGLYAITPDIRSTRALVSQVTASLIGGVRFVQYRNKEAAPELRSEQALALKAACEEHGAFLIVNDHVELALEADADGVHLGAADESVEIARHELGEHKVIGVSCYNRLDLARAAQERDADYVAFGSFYPSHVKPDAVHAPLALLREAKRKIDIPIVAIGGITLQNAGELVGAGADALAVITALFAAPDITSAARDFISLYTNPPTS
jgi:thiamine-phosphate pyrophosphorylase